MYGGSPGGSEADLKSRHHCTDACCCLGFMCSIGAFCALYMWSVTHGNIGKLYHGIDYQGQICGIDAQVQDQPYLYWCMRSVAQGSLSIDSNRPICVSSCPGADSPSTASAIASPTYEIEPDCAAVTGAEGMASYKTVLLLGRYCIPDPIQYAEQAELISEGSLTDFETNVVETLSSIPAAWPVILGSFFVAVMLSYLYLVLLRHCAKPLIWLTMLLAIVGFGFLGCYLWVNAGNLSGELPEGVEMPAGITDNEETITKFTAGVSFALAFVMVCLACCFAHSIDVGSACVEVACDTIFEMPSLLLTPVLKAFFKGILATVLLYGFLLLYSTSDVTTSSNGITRHFSHSQSQIYAILFYMLVAFWILAFVNALYQFIVAYAVAEYYYTPYDHDHEKDVGCCAIWDGFHIGLLLHGGSLAFGALLIALLQVFQKVLEYAKSRNEETADNQVVNCLLCCCLCCVHCCKDVVELVNKNAYIDMAISSNGFCDAARQALQMIVQLGPAMAILNGATFIFTIFGAIIITLGTGFFSDVVASHGTFADNTSEFYVDEPVAVMLVSSIIGLLVALSFMNVFDMASDTLLYCYGLDMQTGNAGYTAPPALKELVHSTGADSH